MTDEQFYDLSERLRGIESLLLTKGNPMVANELKVKVNGLFDRIVNNYRSALFGGRYVNALRAFVLDNIDLVQHHLQAILTGGDFDASVKSIVTIARGNLKLPFPYNIFGGMALTSIEGWMLDKNNRDKMKEWIGSMPVQ